MSALDLPGFNRRSDGVWDLLVLPASGIALVAGAPRVGLLGLALWASRALALYGGKAPRRSP